MKPSLLGSRSRQNPVILRLVFASLVWLVVIASSLRFVSTHPKSDVDGVFVVALVANLLPPLLYAVLIQKRGATITCGILMLLVTAPTWWLAATQTSSAQMVPPVIDGILSIGLIVAVAADEAMRRAS